MPANQHNPFVPKDPIRLPDLTVIEEITENDFFIGTRKNINEITGEITFTDYLYSMQAVLDYVGSTNGGGNQEFSNEFSSEFA